MELRGPRLELPAFALALALATPALARPLTLTPVGNPIPGVGPVGLTVAETRGGTYVIVGDHQGNTVRSLRLDRGTGALTPIGSIPLANGPSALAVSRNGQFVVATTLRGNDVTSLRLDAGTGALSPIGSVPSGGSGPLAVAINDNGVVVVANKDSDSVGVLQLDPQTGALRPIGSHTVGTGPSSITISGNQVVVGTSISNDVHLLRLDRFGALYPVDSAAIGARITSVATSANGNVLAVGTYPNGNVHGFVVGPRRLLSIGSTNTGGDITSLTISEGRLFVAGIQPARVASFELDRHGLQQTGNLAMTGLSSRTLAAVGGPGRTSYVIVNEYNNNQTLVVKAAP